ncbi:hypothetical protein H6F88_18270 [Oculatella sp. FACHB-28]|uniref:hypothetical protein n=1 Tax=Cyanophyceae TaxID=3028117 RepID=UPI0016886445|nr:MULTISPECIES: hypothetical protein [Cyanophyceae]MBD1870368.1 hypothetical protein [Cyanobacteria bacterium FACHB-471]MBD1999135.1 hypothetical protein [Leptolyngbya sp. FACHB-541]MBD2057941.1 hypothetical protein [Oculatella sp. FACHB-28]MBD2070837.1 hypothetical protein [Leptolyngbya sp. FACHB-671]
MKKSQPARYSTPDRQAATRSRQNITAFAYLAGVFVVGVVVILFVQGRLVIGGVPSGIIMEFLQDDLARSAYFSGNSTALHDRLDEIGIEEAMKDYYRPQISDEVVLDQHIHQILYDRTGYVGEDYQVNGGVLVLKDD